MLSASSLDTSPSNGKAGKRTRSLRNGMRFGNANTTHTRYARLINARTTEGIRSGQVVLKWPEPISAEVAAGSNAPRPRPRSFVSMTRDCCNACRSLVLRDARIKRAWKKMPEPRPCTSRASNVAHTLQPRICDSTMQACPSNKKPPKSTRPAMWFALCVVVRVNHSETGMGKYTAPMSMPTNIMADGEVFVGEALISRKAEARIEVKFAEKRPHEARQIH